MAEVIPISKLTAHQRVAQRLRAMLVEGQFAPGIKLNERVLSESLGVSRTPLREALKQMAAEGLVELLPNRGAIAARFTAIDIEHTFETLAGLEAMAGELAAQRITPEELAEIQALHFEMLACFSRRDRSNYYRLNAAIHDGINAAAKNAVLTELYRRMNAPVQAMRFRTNQVAANWQRAVHDHAQMLDALVARDAQGLAQVMARHLMQKKDAVLEQLRADGTESPTD